MPSAGGPTTGLAVLWLQGQTLLVSSEDDLKAGTEWREDLGSWLHSHWSRGCTMVKGNGQEESFSVPLYQRGAGGGERPCRGGAELLSRARLLVTCSPPGSSVHQILPARILEWVAISSSRGSS